MPVVTKLSDILVIIATASISVVCLSWKTWFSIKTENPSDASIKLSRLQRSTIRTLFWLAQAGFVSVLIGEFLWLEGPIARLDWIAIIISCFGLFHYYLEWRASRFISITSKLIDVSQQQIEMLGKLADKTFGTNQDKSS